MRKQEPYLHSMQCEILGRCVCEVPTRIIPQTMPIEKYPDEPHPDNQFEWKAFWVKKMYNPKTWLSQDELEWIHQCWKETKARWNS